jgi:hypothetical protein
MINRFLIRPYMLLFILAVTGCNMPASDNVTPGINITQAYQTVEAHLIEAEAQPPIAAVESPTAAPPLSDGEESAPIATAAAPLSTPQPVCDQAAAAYPKIDITIDDNTEMAPGETFTKVWRVVNVGSCSWTTAYAVVLFSGDGLGASEIIAFTQNIAPNQSVDISVDMVAPNDPGSYQGNWKLRNAAGQYFGIGPNGSSPFWVRINVIQVATITPTDTPTATQTPVVQASGQLILVNDQYVDLDYMQIDTAAGDLLYHYDTPTEHHLIPQSSVVLGIFGSVTPSLSDCQAVILGGSALRLEDVDIGTYLCYRTDLGLYGWVRFDNLSMDDDSLSFEMLTWQTP